jgi:hypothetical protein
MREALLPHFEGKPTPEPDVGTYWNVSNLINPPERIELQ